MSNTDKSRQPQIGRAPCCTPSPLGPDGACGPVTLQQITSSPIVSMPEEPENTLEAHIERIPRVSSNIRFKDRLGAFKVRCNIGRMTYDISPGLYALGTPGRQSEVLVTANYKLTFDKLRSALTARNLWILVLDTAGINVWCAAGKGTFGTSELVKRIGKTRLADIVDHRRVILPQLGAPGVAAHEVKQQSGFKVVYGPVRAEDLPAFLDNGRKASPEMRRKRFPLSERAVLIPVELVGAIKGIVILQAAFLLLSGLGGEAGWIADIRQSGALAATALFAALIGGAVITPLLLPFLPGRAFSVKSLPVGIGLALLVLAWQGGSADLWSTRLEMGAWLLIIPGITAFLAINYTGASTYTSLSGVKKEMRIAVPVQIIASAAGLLLWVASRIAA